MVSDSSVDCGARSISSPVRSAIRSIKEVAGDCPDADIVVMLAETHMDPNVRARAQWARGAQSAAGARCGPGRRAVGPGAARQQWQRGAACEQECRAGAVLGRKAARCARLARAAGWGGARGGCVRLAREPGQVTGRASPGR